MTRRRGLGLCGTTSTPCACARAITRFISPTPPTLVTLRCATSIAPASISARKPSRPAVFSPAESGISYRRKLASSRRVLGRPDRLLEPQQAFARHRGRLAARDGRRPGAVDVEHHRRIGRRGLRGEHRLACEFVQLDVAVPPRTCLRRVARHEFEVAAIREQARIGIERGRRAAAEKAPKRLARPLPEQVPKGDLDAREGINEGAVAPEQVHAVQHLARELDRYRRASGRPRTAPRCCECRLGPAGVEAAAEARRRSATKSLTVPHPDQEDLEPIPRAAPRRAGGDRPSEKGTETTELSTAAISMDAHKLGLARLLQRAELDDPGTRRR